MAVSKAAGDLGGDVACCLPTSLDEGRGKRRALVTLVQRVGVGVNDECALAWPVQAFARAAVRGSGDSGSDGMWVGGGKKQRSDGAMFGNHLLPNIAIISNPALNY